MHEIREKVHNMRGCGANPKNRLSTVSSELNSARTAAGCCATVAMRDLAIEYPTLSAGERSFPQEEGLARAPLIQSADPSAEA